MTTPTAPDGDNQQLRGDAAGRWASTHGGIAVVPLVELAAFCDGWDAACTADPNVGVPDASVTDAAAVVHRCEYRAAAADRKLYADELYRQLRTMREAVLAIHTPVPTWTDSTVDTATGETEQNALYDDAGGLVYAPDHRVHCAACPVDTPWPCPTAAAVEVRL